MSASISDPFLLSSYALPSASSSSSFKHKTHILANQEHPSSSDSFVTVAVQRDGVHVLDPSTLHPAISYTLGPSTSFSCSPVSRTTRVDGVKKCTTYVVVDSSPDIKSDERGRTVWIWEEHLSGGVMSGDAPRTKKSVLLPHPVSHIHLLDSLPERVLLVRENGSIAISDMQLSIRARWRASSQGVVVVCFLRHADTLQVSVVAIDPKDNVQNVASCILDEQKVLEATCSSAGYLSVLTSSGIWHSFQLESDGADLSLSPHISSLRLKGLTFLPSSQPQSYTHASEIAVAALGSAHALLVGISASSSPELVLLLWDLQYGVLLASHTCAVPSSLNRTKKDGSTLMLVAREHAAQRAAGDGHVSRSSILVVPVSVPRESTIAHAMGRANAGARWLVSDSTPKAEVEGVDPAQAKLLRVMRKEIDQSRPEGAEKAFFEWAGRDPSLEHIFVKQVLDIVFRNEHTRSGGAIPYSPKVLRYLLDRRAVSSAMVVGGLLPQSAAMALIAVIDIPEDDMVLSLRIAIVHHHQTHAAADDSMQVDPAPSASDLPSLHDLLALCISYPSSPGALRVALRTHLPDAVDLVPILAILDRWVARGCAEDAPFLSDTHLKDAHDGRPPDGVPPLDKVLAFLQALLDASFLALLSHPPAHAVLRTLSARLQPALALHNTLVQLRGPLQPFAAAHARAVRDAARGPSAPKADMRVDWRKRKRAAHERAELALGLYQVEELVL
ncbi:hypothetical protein B0H21DRAFT_777679 [Amylocystis lapponica]|nr:hypothetical protein B0H21DRAFT_777679 [Amylocystis lapponica]